MSTSDIRQFQISDDLVTLQRSQLKPVPDPRGNGIPSPPPPPFTNIPLPPPPPLNNFGQQNVGQQNVGQQNVVNVKFNENDLKTGLNKLKKVTVPKNISEKIKKYILVYDQCDYWDIDKINEKNAQLKRNNELLFMVFESKEECNDYNKRQQFLKLIDTRFQSMLQRDADDKNNLETLLFKYEKGKPIVRWGRKVTGSLKLRIA